MKSVAIIALLVALVALSSAQRSRFQWDTTTRPSQPTARPSFNARCAAQNGVVSAGACSGEFDMGECTLSTSSNTAKCCCLPSRAFTAAKRKCEAQRGEYVRTRCVAPQTATDSRLFGSTRYHCCKVDYSLAGQGVQLGGDVAVFDDQPAQPVQPAQPAEVPKAPFGDYRKECAKVGGVVVEDAKVCPAGQTMLYQPTKYIFGLLGYDVCCTPAQPVDPVLPAAPVVDLALFRSDCANAQGFVAHNSCPANSNEAFAEDIYRCCLRRRPAPPRPAAPRPQPPVKNPPVQPNLGDFVTDECTAKGGSLWKKCEGGLVSLFRQSATQLCCADPSLTNRNLFKAYVTKCFERQGTYYIRQKCQSRSLIKAVKIGILGEVNCCEN